MMVEEMLVAKLSNFLTFATKQQIETWVNQVKLNTVKGDKGMFSRM